MGRFILVDEYLKIVTELGRWKVIPMSTLFSVGNFSHSYSMFSRRVRVLENQGILKSILGTNKRKILTLTYQGLKFSPYGTKFDFTHDSLNHDLIATNVITELLKKAYFRSGDVAGFTDSQLIDPDGVILGSKSEVDYVLAIEVELNQKSRNRIIDKFNKYLKTADYDYVLYLFNKEAVFNAYKKTICTLDKEVGGKIILLFSHGLTPTRFSLEESECFFKGNRMIFSDIFE